MQRGLALGVPAAAFAASAGLVAQVRRIANAPLPHFEDHDPSGTYGDPAGSPLTVAVLGDSTVTGPGLGEPSHSWIAQMVDRLPHRVELVSFAKGGSRVRDVLLEQTPAALSSGADVMVVAVGANDALHATPGWHFRRDTEALLGVLRAVAPVVSLGVGNLAVIPRMPWALKPAAAWRSAFIDRLHSEVTEGLDGVVRVPVSELSDPHFAGAKPDWWTADLFHPSAIGHRLWADLFEPYMHAVLDGTSGLHDLFSRHSEPSQDAAGQSPDPAGQSRDAADGAEVTVDLRSESGANGGRVTPAGDTREVHSSGYRRCNEHR